jgi:hypothetical protein
MKLLLEEQAFECFVSRASFNMEAITDHGF